MNVKEHLAILWIPMNGIDEIKGILDGFRGETLTYCQGA